MAYPDIRKAVALGFVEKIKDYFPDVQVLAGTSTAGIPHAAWVSSQMDLPMAYVRGSAKSHGKKKQIEGKVSKGDKVVVIEDLISTGGSSLTAVQALKEEGADVLGVVAIFTYGLAKANQIFEANVAYHTLTDFQTLIKVAEEKQLITTEQLEQLKIWHENPEGQDWLQKK